MKPVTALVAAFAGLALGLPAVESDVESLDKRQQATAKWKYCNPTGMCYGMYATQGTSVYGFAIPDITTYGSVFDIAIRMVAPRGTGWIGISWGGSMAGAPLTVAWQNGGTVEISSRWADSHTMPSMYQAANYTVLGDTNVNGTHWTMSAICKGCSQWTKSGATKTLNGDSTGVRVAWAQNTDANGVSQPSNTNSNFAYHHYHNYFDIDFKASKVDAAQWNRALSNQRPAGASNQSPPPSQIQPPAPVQPVPPQNPAFPWWGGFGGR